MRRIILICLVALMMSGCAGMQIAEEDVQLAIDTIQVFITDAEVNEYIDYFQAFYAEDVPELVKLYNEIVDLLINGVEGEWIDGTPTPVKLVD